MKQVYLFLLKLLNFSSIQIPPPRLLFTLVFRAIEPSRKMCSSVSSVRVGGRQGEGGGLSIYRISSPPTNVANGLWNASLSTGSTRITAGKGTELRRDTPRTDTATNYDTILKDLYFALVPLASMDDGSLPLKRGFNYYDEIRLDANFCF